MSFEIIEHIGVLSTNDKGWSVELNKVSWSGREAVYDIRAWNEDHTRCGKGKTFQAEELYDLQGILANLKIYG